MASAILFEIVSAIPSGISPAVAQIIPDRTLGSESSRVSPTEPQADRIDGGAIRGSSLFHSFQEFNIGEGRSAFFANPAGVENRLLA